ncbi:MAG: metalloenzyme domain-containing protein [Chloroflexota bacterium]
MKALLVFLDGVGLGSSDPEGNPLAAAEMPALRSLLEGRQLVGAALNGGAPPAPGTAWHGQRASLLALDAGLGVSGLPQSATGQAVLLTGRNLPAELGYHYGPKPNPAVAEAIGRGTLFSRAAAAGKRTAFLNAFPDGYFQAVESGRRLYAAMALAAVQAGTPLRTLDDLRQGQAVSADLTGQGLRERLGLADVPVIDAAQAGQRLAQLGLAHDFSLFEYWLSDYAGHGQEMAPALELLDTLDAALGGLAAAWDDAQGLVVITSDHGNLEDLSTRKHTANPAPLLLIGSRPLREAFAAGAADLTHVAPAILRLLGI